MMASIALESAQPQTIGEAFAHINQVTAPTIADFKIMVLVEAASETLYRHTATGTDNAAVIALLHDNGAEEMIHARRVSEVIRVLGGGDFPARGHVERAGAGRNQFDHLARRRQPLVLRPYSAAQ